MEEDLNEFSLNVREGEGDLDEWNGLRIGVVDEVVDDDWEDFDVDELIEPRFQQGEQQPLTHEWMTFQTRVKENFFFFSTIFSLILILIIAITSLNLQVIQGARLFGEINNGARFKTEFVSAMRGLIFDRMGRPLVENKSSYSLYLNPINILDVNYLKFILSEATFRDIDYAISIYNQNPNYDKVLLDNNYDNSIFITKYFTIKSYFIFIKPM